MTKNDTRRLKTQQALTNAFFELYATNNIERITVNDIVRRAGYNRSTFYAYYRDVYEVLEKAEDELLDLVEKVGSELLYSLTQASLDQEFIVLFSFIKEHELSFPTIIRKHGFSFTSKLRDAVLRACEDQYPELSENDIQVLDQCLIYHFSSLVGMFSHWFENQGCIPVDQVFPLIKELSLKGVIPKLRNLTHPLDPVSDTA